jgi:hypothetical protein
VSATPQRRLDPNTGWRTSRPIWRPVHAASRRVFARVLEAGVDVPTVDPDGRRAREAESLGNRWIGSVDVLDRGAWSDLVDHLAKKGAGLFMVRASREPQEFDLAHAEIIADSGRDSHAPAARSHPPEASGSCAAIKGPRPGRYQGSGEDAVV